MKRYSIMRVEEFRKRYETMTTSMLVQTGHTSSDGIGQHLDVSMPDAETPEMNQLFLVTIEPIARPDGVTSHVGDWGDKFIEQRRAEDTAKASGIKTGRKFR